MPAVRWFGDLAERLHDTGWPAPIPLRPRSKAPLIAGWTRYNAAPVAAATLAAWVRRYPDAGIGHPAGHGIAFVDLDEDDPARATRLKALVREVLGDTPLRRVGRPPREVLVYRRAVGSTMPSALVAAPGVALYLDSGQVALFAIHPDTGRPYLWPLDDPTMIAPGDLPAVTDAHLADLLDAARACPVIRGGQAAHHLWRAQASLFRCWRPCASLASARSTSPADTSPTPSPASGITAWLAPS